ncbi:MAG: RNA methyltransferase [Clostridia bacterium]|nr:RNA methyltransferase [Clostridia bacterium]
MVNFNEISSKDNPLVKLVSSLQSSAKSRKEAGLFVIEGIRICEDAMENGVIFDKLIVSKTACDKYPESIEKFSQIARNSYIFTDSLFKKICDTENPQGVLIVCEMPCLNEKINQKGRYIALENLQDPSNLGAISRTAEALGISGIIISGDSCDAFSPKVLRVSMGTILRMPVFFTDNIIGFVNKNNLRSFACVVDKDAKSISEISFNDGDVILIGNEGNGLREETKEMANNRVTIKMQGNAESLNAAAAAAIAMWELKGRAK